MQNVRIKLFTLVLRRICDGNAEKLTNNQVLALRRFWGKKRGRLLAPHRRVETPAGSKCILGQRWDTSRLESAYGLADGREDVDSVACPLGSEDLR